MRPISLFAAGAVVTSVSALPSFSRHWTRQTAAGNPFDGKKLVANPSWAAKLEQTYEAFVAKGDLVNAQKVRTIQNVGTFFWVSDIKSLANIDDAIAAAREAKEKTGEEQIVGLVLYNLPDRDCSAGESAGELQGAEGLARYKAEYIAPYAAKVSAADDLTFAIVVEPDSVGNLVTNMAVEFCANAAPIYKEGIAHAIKSLQYPNVNLYLDVAHGGWLGWDDNLQPTAEIFGEILRSSGNSTKIRGFSTNVSNYNPFQALVRENFTEWSNSWDESHYIASLAPHLEEEGLPARFIVDQGRVALPGARAEWGEWCNVSPAGFGLQPGTKTNSTLLDSIVWVKPGGESDGACGLEGAPRAGAWFDEYIQMLVENADVSIKPAVI